MDEEKAGDAGSIGAFLEEKTFRARTVLVFGQITDTLAGATVGRLIALSSASDAPINLLVSSPGGHVESGDVLHDIVCFIRTPVNMIGTVLGRKRRDAPLSSGPEGAQVLPAEHAIPDPSAQRRRRRPSLGHRNPGARTGARAPAHRGRDCAGNRALARVGALGYRPRSVDVGRGGDRVRAGFENHHPAGRVAGVED